MKASKFLTMTVLGAALILSACGQKSDDDNTSMASRSGRGADPSYTSSTSGGTYYTASTGSITPENGYANSFESMIKGLLSGSMDTTDGNVGSIDTNAVAFQGYVEVDSSGRMVNNPSSIAIIVKDSLAKSPADAITLHIPAYSGGVNLTNGAVSLTFHDQFGDVVLNGSLSGSTFSGHLAFKNNKSYDSSGSSAGHSLDTGVNYIKFQIDTCGFFKCSH